MLFIYINNYDMIKTNFVKSLDTMAINCVAELPIVNIRDQWKKTRAKKDPDIKN